MPRKYLRCFNLLGTTGTNRYNDPAFLFYWKLTPVNWKLLMSTPELLFTVGNIAILPFWTLMILAPRWGWTGRIMQSLWPVIVLAALYALSLLSTAFVGESVDMSKLTLDVHGIAYLLSSPVGAATAWLHLIAFDLFVGRWVYLDSRPCNLPVWIVSIALFFVFFTGPFGLLLYLALRYFQTKS
jgi:hypothetical protein